MIFNKDIDAIEKQENKKEIFEKGEKEQDVNIENKKKVIQPFQRKLREKKFLRKNLLVRWEKLII